MPLIEPSSYKSPFWLPEGHSQTMVPALFRKVPQVTCMKERLELPDGDFLDLGWSGKNGQRLAILSHGLEASAETEYIQGMAAVLVRHGWDALTWTFRGCGKEPNRLLQMYHSGSTGDLDAIIQHALANHPATKVDLIGFSLGGNLTLKYLGEGRFPLSPRLHRAIAISVPCDLESSSRKLARLSNKLYMERFMIKMRAKIRMKNRMFPGEIDFTGLDRMRTFQEFDDRFTAPLHGFRDAADYWEKSSCKTFLEGIRIPTLLFNAANDPFLGPECYPWDEAERSAFLHLEVPATGGHVGFSPMPGCEDYGSEVRAIQFLNE